MEFSKCQLPAVPTLWLGWRCLGKMSVTPGHVKTKIHSLTSDCSKMAPADFVWFFFLKVDPFTKLGYANVSSEMKWYIKD